MGATYVYRLAPLSAFHFGLRGVGIEQSEGYCPADTLFSALCLTLRQLEPEGDRALSRWLAGFPPLSDGGPPPLRISSAFPYAGKVLFFPKPMVPANLPPETRRSRAKQLKKVRVVSLGILKAWLAQADLNGELEDAQFLHGGKVWVTAAELGRLEDFVDPRSGKIKIWSTEPLPRVAVDRVTARSSVYQAGVVRFRPGAGLYTLAQFPNGDAEKEQGRLGTLLQVLGDSGLGGERSSGYGHFRPEGPEPFEGWGDTQGDLFVTLAPYHPTREEVAAGVLDEGAAYDLQTRRGWVSSPGGGNLRRRLVRVLGEGSLLHHTGAGGYGDLADATPREKETKDALLPHNVWRYGIAFPVPATKPVIRKEDCHG